MRKAIIILLLAAGAIWTVPALATAEFCSVDPCCSMDQPMDCCTIEEAPVEQPELVLTETTRTFAVSLMSLLETTLVMESVSSELEYSTEVFESPPRDRLTLLSIFLL
ncbi:MAG: hypothetical protein R3338_09685 [Thermoanaerobaculia bacterium]|nr:hypothetical protein [Thermoanaerobaculia bacterium]